MRRAAAVAAGLALLAPGCGGGPPGAGGVATYVLADVSPSTAAERVPGGLYETSLRRALDATAAAGGTFSAAAVAGNGAAVAWSVDAVGFAADVGGNRRLAAVARRRAARRLLPRLRRLVASHGGRGSDLLGALARGANAARELPAGRPRVIVLVTDGAIVTRAYDFYARPPRDARERVRVIARLRAAGALADLHGVDICLVGVGVGISDPDAARAAVALWPPLVRAMGGRVVCDDASLHFPSLPAR